MYIAPADASLIGGQGAVVKTAGANLDGLIVREPAAIDMTLGEPPKRPARTQNRDPFTRMAEAAMIRQSLIKAHKREVRASACDVGSDIFWVQFDNARILCDGLIEILLLECSIPGSVCFSYLSGFVLLRCLFPDRRLCLRIVSLIKVNDDGDHNKGRYRCQH